jgi:hypothetical protein
VVCRFAAEGVEVLSFTGDILERDIYTKLELIFSSGSWVVKCEMRD